MDNKEIFQAEYAKQLRLAIEAHPGDYLWPVSELETVLGRMSTAIERGSFNKDSHAFKATCKALKIPHTYKAIKEFREAQTVRQ
jgi:hypothetical protein